MIEQPSQTRSLPSWLGQGTEQHMANTKKELANLEYKVNMTHNQAQWQNITVKVKVNMVIRVE